MRATSEGADRADRLRPAEIAMTGTVSRLQILQEGKAGFAGRVAAVGSGAVGRVISSA